MLAIVGLIAGRAYGWTFMDPLMGVVGAVVIARWSVGLLRGSASVLLDLRPDTGAMATIRLAIEADGARIVDLHLRDVGPGHTAAIVSLVTDRPQTPAHYKELVGKYLDIFHLTVEVNAFPRPV
jgi:Co/Zn/Cd efflux system component